ncbi:hypothetical protein EYZ11_004808 [Aspergillus tanneri]|uniref:NADPH-dependent diflavin oxidoreductase 1 n=1 Tax=Aspergillus tanneri TaxID=1220188 RepID=A0A4S3JK68_9EURO|nr:hypothetical protein EYZ11_004808 [Aspergillus tanneri]
MSESQSPTLRKRSALVLYGSETGNAHEVAEELGVLAERLHFVTQVSELNHVKPEILHSFTVTIFALSTTGQGDLPANARSFWRSLLLKRLPPTFLNGVNFVSFGLGDSSYPKDYYNWAQRRSIRLGKPTNSTQKGTFIPWLTDFRQHLLDTYPLPPGQTPIPEDVQLPPKWVLQPQVQSTSDQAEPTVPGMQEGLADPSEFPQLTRLDHDLRPIPDTLTATLTANKRVTPPKHWQDVRHVTLTVPDAVSYAPGDMISITPKNFADDVQALITMMGWEEQADQPVTLVPRDSQYLGDESHPPPIPGLESYPRLTLRALLMDYLDIRAIPRRAFFSTIAHYTSDEMHKERLLEFTDPEFLDELWDYTTRPRRSILEALYEFDSVKIPWQHAVSVLPLLRARQFSIASGGELKRTAEGGTKFELLIATVKYRTIIKRIREGICTKYISVLRPGSTLKVQLQRGGLNSSVSQLTGPTVLIGPGTGVAPLRSMLWEKAALVKEFQAHHGDAESPFGPTILLYGGRNRAADFFFEEEWQKLSDLIQLQVFTAFSRDQDQKIYVQDVISKNLGLFYRFLHELSGTVYVCGSSGKMPEAVRESLTEAFQRGGEPEREQCSREEAEEYLIGMEKSGRYKQETW